MTAVVGYARTSTIVQEAGLEAQVRDLKAAGVTKLFQEQVSSVATREKLEAALDYLREGDVLVVTKLDRLARSTQNLLDIVRKVTAKGASLRVLNLGGANLDTASPAGKAILGIFGVIAEFERDLMLERQREGIAKAKAEGKYRGRKTTATLPGNFISVADRLSKGEPATKVAKDLGISRSSLYRIKRQLDRGKNEHEAQR